MKKVLLLLMALVMSLSFAACGYPEAYAIFEASDEAMADVDSMRMLYTIETEVDGEKATAFADLQMKIHSDTSIDLAVEMETEDMLGNKTPTSVYMTDGAMYMKSGELKYKVPFDLEASTAVSEELLAGLDLESLNDEDFIESVSVSERNGFKTIYVTAKADLINSVMGGMLEAVLESDAASIDFDFVKMSITFDEDNMMTSINMSYDGTVSASGETVNMKYNAKIRITDYNEIDEISFPFDLYTYPSILS